MHRSLSSEEREKNDFVWEETQLKSFDELIISWNAERPIKGAYLIQVSVLTANWSPWLNYAWWSAQDQKTFKEKSPDSTIQVYQDAVEMGQNIKAHGFRVRVKAVNDNSLNRFRGLHASAVDRSAHSITFDNSENRSISLKLNGISQMALLDERCFRLCSPTSTTAVVQYLLGDSNFTAIEFANNVVDSTFDIYGNWILNIAQASHLLGASWRCFVVRFTKFNQIIDQLMKGLPVIVSIKGQITGGARPYESGHLIVVTGYNAQTQVVSCMDPAFPEDELTHVKYSLDEFLTAWSRRQGIAYLFDRT